MSGHKDAATSKDQLLQYQVVEAIGNGMFGKVEKIVRISDGKNYVWKIIDFKSMSEKEKAQIVSEVNILRELKCPFIVKYSDRIVDKQTTKLYLIMEYCSNGDLARFIKINKNRNNFIDEEFIWKVFAQIVLALKECHQRCNNGMLQPILHRDIKPANILLDSNMNIKMADFGLAKQLNGRGDLASTNVGTPYYMAPEVISEKDYDDRADIWSLGCLLYELCALHPPFDASNAVSLALKINTGQFVELPSKYSVALCDAVYSMLVVDKHKRPRISDLEKITGLQIHLHSNRLIVHEYTLSCSYHSKMKELLVKEKELQVKEKELEVKERELSRRERQLVEQKPSVGSKPGCGFVIHTDHVGDTFVKKATNTKASIHTGAESAKENVDVYRINTTKMLPPPPMLNKFHGLINPENVLRRNEVNDTKVAENSPYKKHRVV